MNIAINGGTRGIGRELVRLLASDKANKLLVTGRNENSLRALAEEFTNIDWVAIDLEDTSRLENKLEEYFKSKSRKIDILVNMAGGLISKDFIDFSDPEARMLMNVNFFGPAAFIRSVRPHMPEGSHIVNITSMGGFQGSSKYKGLSYYSASKAALACLTECLAVELSEYGISVNCLALGAVQTEMLSEAFPGYKAPVTPVEMAGFISNFALNGHKAFNGKILPVALSNP